MKKLIYILLICSSLAFLLLSCDGDPKPNPCAGKQTTTATFTVSERVDNATRKANGWTYWVNYNTDTILFNWVHFKADLDSTEGTMYQWYIGNKFYVYTREFDINFYNRELKDSIIPIQLRVKQNITKGCFANDTNIAQFTKNIVLYNPSSKDVCISATGQYCEINSNLKSAVQGTFVGQYFDIFNEGKVYENDTLIIRFNWDRTKEFSQGWYWTRFRNWFYLSDFKRNPDFFNVSQSYNWGYLGGSISGGDGTAYGYKQLLSTQFGVSTRFFLSDKNTVETYYKDKLWFKGKRLKY